MSQAQIIQVPNTLKLKVGGRFTGLDPASVAKAEAALKSLSGNFGAWLNDEVAKVDEARETIRLDGFTTATAEALYLRLHDLKGLGATYEFPLVSRIAGSLCKLVDEPATRLSAPLYLIDAHIDAIKAAIRGDIRSDANPVGRRLAEELESRVAEVMSGWAPAAA